MTSRPPAIPRSPTPRRPHACCGRSATPSATTRSSLAGRPELRARVVAPSRGGRERAELRVRHRRRRGAGTDRRPSLPARVEGLAGVLAPGGEAVSTIATVNETRPDVALPDEAMRHVQRLAVGVAAARRSQLLRSPVARPRGTGIVAVRDHGAGPPHDGSDRVPHRSRRIGRRRGLTPAPHARVARRRDPRG